MSAVSISAGKLVPAVAILAALVSGGWLATQWSGPDSGWGPSGSIHGPSMWGGGMMGGVGGSGWSSSPEGVPVQDLTQARARVADFVAEVGSDLTVGEVMAFERNFYAELHEPDGDPATEVLVDRATGAVQVEYGPARMWNERYGVMGSATGGGDMTAEAAREQAAQWALTRDVKVGEASAFPGYFTFHTVRDGRIEGMVSVNGADGRVWYHGWHGRFLDMSEPQ